MGQGSFHYYSIVVGPILHNNIWYLYSSFQGPKGLWGRDIYSITLFLYSILFNGLRIQLWGLGRQMNYGDCPLWLDGLSTHLNICPAVFTPTGIPMCRIIHIPRRHFLLPPPHLSETMRSDPHNKCKNTQTYNPMHTQNPQTHARTHPQHALHFTLNHSMLVQYICCKCVKYSDSHWKHTEEYISSNVHQRSWFFLIVQRGSCLK